MQNAARAVKAVYSNIYGVGRLASRLLIVGVLLTVVMVAALSTDRAHAATNSTMNFQARVLTSGGAVIPDGSVNVEFNLYSADSGGSTLWTEGQTVSVKNGYVSASLGSINPFPGTINWDQGLWLTLNVNGDGEMDPRMKITAVPYAFRASQLAIYNAGTGFTSTLGITSPTGGDQIFNLPDLASATSATLITTGNLNAINGVGTLTSGTWNASTIEASHGGTGQSSYTTGDLLYAVDGTSLGKLNAVASGSCLVSNGTSVAPSWGSCSGSIAVTQIGAFDSQAKSLDGAVISGTSLYLQSADDTHPGLISTGTQTLAGAKTFNDFLTVAPGSGGAEINDMLMVYGSTSDDTSHALNVQNSNGDHLLFVRNDGSVGIGTDGFGSFDPLNPERLLVDAGTTTKNVVSGTGEINGWLQLNIRNKSNGSDASSDIVATADNGDDSSNYIDMGINGSGYNDDGSLPNDSYLYSNANNMLIGNASEGKDIIFFTNGADAYTNERMRITSDGQVKMRSILVQNSGVLNSDSITISAYAGGSNPYTGTITSNDLTGARTWIMQDANYVLAGIDLSQTFSADQTFASTLNSSYSPTANNSALKVAGTWYSGGSATTTRPQLLVEPSTATSNAWNVNGTGIGVNSVATFTGNLLDAQINGVSKFAVDYTGKLTVNSGSTSVFNLTNTGQLNLVSDLTTAARATSALSITQAQNVANNSTVALLSVTNSDLLSTGAMVSFTQSATAAANAMLITTASTTAALTITTPAGGTAYAATGVTTGTGLNLNTVTGTAITATGAITGNGLVVTGITSGNGASLGGAAQTTGSGLLINTTSNTLSTGKGVNITGAAAGVTADFSGAYINLTPTRTLAAAAVRNDTGNFLNMARSITTTNAGSTYNLSGALVNLTNNCTRTAGTCNDTGQMINVNQQDALSSGTILNIVGAGTGNLAILDTTNALANGLSIDVQSANAAQYVFKTTSNNAAINGLIVLANGNVGVGNAAPGSLFTVGTGSALIIDNSGNINTTGGVTAASHSGNGSGLTSLNATNISSGTIGDTYLSSNVVLLTGTQTITGAKTLSAGLTVSGGTTTISTLGAGLVQSGSGGALSSGTVDRNSSTFFNTALSATNGGTGISSYTAGDLIIASNTTTLTTISAVASGSCLQSNGIGAVPVWGTCSGSGSGTTIIGSLDGQARTANGATISGAYLYLQTADNTHPGLISAVAQTFGGVKTFADGIIITTGGASITGNSSITGTLTGLTGLTVASGGANITGATTITGSLTGLTSLTSSGTITLSSLGAGLVQSGSGGALSSGAVDRNSTTFFNTALTAANGGTGLSSYTAGDLIYASSGTNLSTITAVASGQCLVSGGVGAAPNWGSCSGGLTNITTQGNTFNGAGQLVQLDGSGYLPALNGSALTNLNATNISSGTVGDSYLSTNIALLNRANQTFSGTNSFSDAVTVTSGGLAITGGLNLTDGLGHKSSIVSSALTTDQSFILPATGGTLCVQGSVGCGFVSLTSGFVNGGNSFSGLATFGTTNNYDLRFMTNGNEVGRFTTSGSLVVGNGATAPRNGEMVDINGTLRSNKYIMGTGPDLSLIPVVGGQSAISSWWGLQLVGGRQASVDYTPVDIVAAGNVGVIIPVQNANNVGLAIKGIANQQSDLFQVIDSNANVLARIDKTGSMGIGSSSFDATNPEKLLIDAGVTTSVNAVYAKGSINNYLQFNIHNESNGTQASSDIVATADNGTETTNFIDLGINGSGYVYTAGNPIMTGHANDGYLLSYGNDFYLVNSNSTKDTIFLTGGSDATDEHMRITSDGHVNITGVFTQNSGTTNSDSISLGGYAGGTNPFTGTLTSVDLTAARTWTMQDANYTLAGINIAQTYTQAQTYGVSAVANTSAIKAASVWYSGGTSTTTKPQLLVEANGAASTGWSPNGTGIGINAIASFTGNLIDTQINGVSKFSVNSAGTVLAGGNTTVTGGQLVLGDDTATPQAGLVSFNDTTASNGFTSVLGTSVLSASRAINLPNEDGTLCIQASSNCGFVFFARASAQTDATTNPSIFINKTGLSGNIITLQDGGTTVYSVANSGALQIQLSSTGAFNVKNGTGTDYFNIDTSAGIVRIGGASVDGTGVTLVLDNKNTAGDPAGEEGAMYYNSKMGNFRCYQNSRGWTDCLGVPKPNTRRSTQIVYPGSGITFPVPQGDIVQPTGTASAIAATTTEPTMMNYATSTANNFVAGINGNANYNRSGSPSFQTYIQMPAVPATMRTWIGLTNQSRATMGASNNPAGNYAMFRYDTATDGTTWRCVVKDGTTITPNPTNDTGIPANTTTGLDMEIILSATNAAFKINGVEVCNLTANLPQANNMMRYSLSITNLVGSAHNFRIGWVYVDSDK